MSEEELIKKVFHENGMDITDKSASQLFTYYKYLVEENNKFNLTAITDFKDVVYKHFLDSALAIKNFKGKVLDVGSGAGFPGIVIAILNPNLKITLLDSLNKRINFLLELIKILNLKNVEAVHCRSEDYNKKEEYDVVTARAVANLSTLAEYLIPFLKIGGNAVIYKGADIFEELESAQEAISVLGAQISEIQRYNYENNSRALIILRKIRKTPGNYPRKGNLPRKKPLWYAFHKNKCML